MVTGLQACEPNSVGRNGHGHGHDHGAQGWRAADTPLLWHLPCRFRCGCLLPRQPSSKRHYESRKLPAPVHVLLRLELPKCRSYFAILITTDS